MSLLKIDFRTEDSINESIEAIADGFANRVALQVNDALYRIVDFEFYLYSEHFKDPYTYRHSLQKEHGRLLLHASGMDITVGDGTNEGGILIRSVVNLSTNDQPNGPINVKTKVLSHLYPLTDSNANTIKLMPTELKPAPIKATSTRRIGLRPKSADENEVFLKKPLRYIVWFSRKDLELKIDEKESALRCALERGKIEADKVEPILGYKPSWL
jgi:hypothetical protein